MSIRIFKLFENIHIHNDSIGAFPDYLLVDENENILKGEL